jgi:hypothetical protein
MEIDWQTYKGKYLELKYPRLNSIKYVKLLDVDLLNLMFKYSNEEKTRIFNKRSLERVLNNNKNNIRVLSESEYNLLIIN